MLNATEPKTKEGLAVGAVQRDGAESIRKSGVGAQFVGGNTDGGGFWNLN